MSPAGSVPASASPDRRGGTAILVVDDDPHALRHMRDALAAAGYTPVTAAGPGGVARLVETRQPALAVLDLVLPGADGIELMRTLPALADLPVIFVSAYGRGETIARALEAGAADYIVKPFSPAELVARVGVALNRHAAPGPFVLGDLAIDRATRRATVAGRPVMIRPAWTRTSVDGTPQEPTGRRCRGYAPVFPPRRRRSGAIPLPARTNAAHALRR